MSSPVPAPDMVAIARRVLGDNGFAPDLPADLDDTLPANDPDEGAADLRGLPWSSIDNEESRDLDQIEVAEPLPEGAIRIRIGIADVDALAPKGSPVDRAAAVNTTTLYTGVHVFPMLPEVLSTGRTSLLGDQERLAVVTDIVVRADGSIDDASTQIYVARVVNHAKLVYERVGAWLEGERGAAAPTTEHGADRQRARVHDDAVLAQQLRLQDDAAQRLRRRRIEHGALELETVEARPVMKDGVVVDLEVAHKNRARQLVEDLMIAANGATARYLEARGRSSLRRVVRAPKRWDRIVALAAELAVALPPEPSAQALSRFLAVRRLAAPEKYGELCLSIVKLMGPGQYVLQRATDPDIGHFGLAVDDYAHSTAPNRRYTDLITQRLLKAAAAAAPAPYSDDELTHIADHCTAQENGARKVERTMRKVAAAALLSTRVGDEFDAIVTGATDKGVFVRLLQPPAEGRVVRGERGLDVGDRVRVRLTDTEVSRGFIDFVVV